MPGYNGPAEPVFEWPDINFTKEVTVAKAQLNQETRCQKARKAIAFAIQQASDLGVNKTSYTFMRESDLVIIEKELIHAKFDCFSLNQVLTISW